MALNGAKLIHLKKGNPGKVLDVTSDVVAIGSDFRSDIRILKADVDRQHCCIERRGSKVVLVNCSESSNVLLNGTQVLNVSDIKTGDIITVSNRKFLWNFDDANAKPFRRFTTFEQENASSQTESKGRSLFHRFRQRQSVPVIRSPNSQREVTPEKQIAIVKPMINTARNSSAGNSSTALMVSPIMHVSRYRSRSLDYEQPNQNILDSVSPTGPKIIQKRTARMSTGRIFPLIHVVKRKSIRTSSTQKIAKLRKATQRAVDASVKSIKDTVGRVSSTKKNQKGKAKARAVKHTPKREYVKKPAVKRKFSEEEVNIMNSKKRKLNSPAPDAKKKAALMVLTATPEQSVKKNAANYPNHAYTTEIPKQFKFGETSFGDTSVASTSTANVQWNTSKRLKSASATKKNRDSLRKSVLKTPLKKIDLSQGRMYNYSIKSDDSLLQSDSDNKSISINDESYTNEVSVSLSIGQETNSFCQDENVSSKKQIPVNPRRSTRFNSAPPEENKSIIINKNSDEITKHTPARGTRHSMRNNPDMSLQNSLLLDIFNTPSTSKCQPELELIESSSYSENNDYVDNSLPLIDKTSEVSQITSFNNTRTTRSNQKVKSSNKSSRISNVNLSKKSSAPSDLLNTPNTSKKFSSMTEIASKAAQTENVIDSSMLSEKYDLLDSSIPTSNRTFEISQIDSNNTHTAGLNNTFTNISLNKTDVVPDGNQTQALDIFNTPSTSKVLDFKTNIAGNEVLSSTQSEASEIPQNVSSNNSRTTRSSYKYEKSICDINRSEKSLVNLEQATNSNATVNESLDITKDISNVPKNNVTKSSELDVEERSTSMNASVKHSRTRSSNRISNQNNSRSKIPVLTPKKVLAHTSTPKKNRESDSIIFKTPASVAKLRSNKSLTYSSAKNGKIKELVKDLIADQSIIEEEGVENSLNISTPVASKKISTVNKSKSVVFDHSVNNTSNEENSLHKSQLSVAQSQNAEDLQDDLVAGCSIIEEEPLVSETNTSKISKNHHLTLPLAKVRRTNRKLSLSSSFRANAVSSTTEIATTMVSFNAPSSIESFNLEEELDTSALGSKQSVTLPLVQTRRSMRNASMTYTAKNGQKMDSDIFKTPSIVVTSDVSVTNKTDKESLKDLTPVQSINNEVFENALTSSTPEASKKSQTLSKSKSVVFDPSLFSTSNDDHSLLHPDSSAAQLQSTGDSESGLVEESSSPVLESNESVSSNVVQRSHHLTLPLAKVRRTSRKLSLSTSLEAKATSSKTSASEITEETFNESLEPSNLGQFDTSAMGSKHSITFPLVHKRRSMRNISMTSYKDTKTEIFNVQPSASGCISKDGIENDMISDSQPDNEEKTPENREMPGKLELQFESTPISTTRRSGRISEHDKNTSTRTLRTDSGNKSVHAGDLHSNSNDEQSVTPKTTIKLLAEIVKKQHSTAKKSISRRTIDPEILLHPLSKKTKELQANVDKDEIKTGNINAVKSPENNLLNISGVKKLFSTKSPKNDLRNVAGIRNLFDQQNEIKSPKNDLTNVAGVRSLFDQQRRILSPINDLTNISGIKHFLQSSPMNTYEVSGIESLFKENVTEETVSNMDNSFDMLISKPVIKKIYGNRSRSLSPLKHQKESIRHSVGHVLHKDVDVKAWLEEQKTINNKQNEENQIISSNTIRNEITEAEPSTSYISSNKQPKLRTRLYSATDGIYALETDTIDLTNLSQHTIIESDHPALTTSHLRKRKKPLMDPRFRELSAKKYSNKPRNKKQTSSIEAIKSSRFVDPDVIEEDPSITVPKLRQCFVLIDELKKYDGAGSSQENSVIQQGEIIDLTNDDTPSKMESVVDVAPQLKLKKGKKEVQKAAELEQIESVVSTTPVKRSTRTRGIKNGRVSAENEIEKTESNVLNTPLKRSTRVKASNKQSESSSSQDPPLKRTRRTKKENMEDTVNPSASISEIEQTPSKRTRRAKAIMKDEIETKASVKNVVEKEFELGNAVESKTPLKLAKKPKQNTSKNEKEHEETEIPLKRTRRAKQIASEDKNISEIIPEVKTPARSKGGAKETVPEIVLENVTPLKRTRGRNATKEAKNSDEQDEISVPIKRTRKGNKKAEASPKTEKLDSKINEEIAQAEDEPSKSTKRPTRGRGANKEQENSSERVITLPKRGRGGKGKTEENAEAETGTPVKVSKGKSTKGKAATEGTGKSKNKNELEQAAEENPQRVTRSRKKMA